MYIFYFFLFFFSSRRRHTRYWRDWSSDVCSSDLDQVLNRNLNELLQELRVAFTGVQIMFAFLLGLAFTQRFTELDGFGVTVYTVALLTTASATMLLLAPVSFHRIVDRKSVV